MGLAGRLVAADCAGVPELGEPLAAGLQVSDQLPEPLVSRIAASGGTQVGDLGGFQLAPGLRGRLDAVDWAEERTPDAVAFVAAQLGRVAHQCGERLVGDQQRPSRVVDRDGGAGQPVQHPLDARRDVRRDGVPSWRGEAGQLEQVTALGSVPASSGVPGPGPPRPAPTGWRRGPAPAG